MSAARRGRSIEGLPADGYAILHDVDCGPDVRCPHRRDGGDLRHRPAATCGRVVVGRDDELRPTVRIESPWGTGEVALAVRGDHQAANAAAAVAAAVCAGVGFDAALAGVAAAEGSRAAGPSSGGRPSGLRVLNDSYNANPDSVAAACGPWPRVDAPRRVAVLGEMAELGAGRPDAHRADGRVGRLARHRGGRRRDARPTAARWWPTRTEALALVRRPARRTARSWSRPAAPWASTGWPTTPWWRRGGGPVKVLLFFGGPSEERDVSAGSIKPWVTYLQADPTAELTVVFVDRELRAFRLPPVYYYANTCADFESQLRALDLELDWDEVADAGPSARRRRPPRPRRLRRGRRPPAPPRVLGCALRVQHPRRPRAHPGQGAVLRRAGRCRVPGAGRTGGGPPAAWAADPDGVAADLAGLVPVLGASRPGRRGGGRPSVAVKPLAGGSSFGVDVVPADTVRPDPGRRGGLRHHRRRRAGGGVPGRHRVLGGGARRSGRAADGAGPDRGGEAAGSRVYGTEEKYLHGSGVLHHTPMRVDDGVLHEIRHRAAEAFAVLGLRHMARIDGFRTGAGTIVVTDVNGIGGMGFSSFVFQQAAMVGLDHRSADHGPAGAAPAAADVTAGDVAAGGGGPAGSTWSSAGPPASARSAGRAAASSACPCWPRGTTSAST